MDVKNVGQYVCARTVWETYGYLAPIPVLTHATDDRVVGHLQWGAVVEPIEYAVYDAQGRMTGAGLGLSAVAAGSPSIRVHARAGNVEGWLSAMILRVKR
jgi:hypothetical protein